MTKNQEFDDSDDGLPGVIGSAIKNRYGPIPAVPPDVDNAILADARQHLSTRHPFIARQRRMGSWQWAAIATTVAAAAVMCVVWLPNQTGQDGAVQMASDTASAVDNDVISDVDQNGRIDILDAFTMARQIQSGERTHDINSDGRFDKLDVELLAQRAVML